MISTEKRGSRYHPESRKKLPDLTDYNFKSAPLYRSKSDSVALVAEQLTQDEIIVRSWGVQEMKAGDWVVLKPSSSGGFKRSGVRKEAFEATYIRLNSGKFQKQSFVRAAQIDFDYQFLGIDSDKPESAPAGSYIVLNCDKNQQPIIINGRRDFFSIKKKIL